jgi:hypothetical protein
MSHYDWMSEEFTPEELATVTRFKTLYPSEMIGLALMIGTQIETALRQVAASNLIVAQATLVTASRLDIDIEEWRTVNAAIAEMNRELA